MKIVEKARQMAADGQGKRPRYLAPVPCDADRAAAVFVLASDRQAPCPDGGGSTSSPLDGDASAEPPLDARGLGTLVHAVLEEIDFARPGDVAELVRRLAEQHLSGDGAAAGGVAGRRDDRAVLASPRAAELAAAKEMFRELEFLLAWPPELRSRSRDGRAICKGSSTASTATPPASGG